MANVQTLQVPAKSAMELELDRLRAENTKLKTVIVANEKAVSWKVSQKGAISIYGLGRFPVTLYKGQYNKLKAHLTAIDTWIDSNPSAVHEIDGAKVEVRLSVRDKDMD